MGLFDEYKVPVTYEMSETLSGDLLEEVPAPFPKQYYPLAHLKEGMHLHHEMCMYCSTEGLTFVFSLR